MVNPQTTDEWQQLPKIPTNEMLEALCCAYRNWQNNGKYTYGWHMNEAYKAMLTNAPEASCPTKP